MRRMRSLLWANVFALVAMVVVNAIANIVPLGGNTTGQVSELYPSLFAPAPWTFGIWGVIYLLMLVFVLYQAGVFGDRLGTTMMRWHVSAWFAISCGLNILWVLLWHFRLVGLALVCIILLLFSLLIINRSVSYYYAKETWPNRISVYGFQLYLGWVSAATFANASVFFTKIGWLGFGLSGEVWMVAMLLAGMVLGASFSIADDLPFATVGMAWAYAGLLGAYLSPAGFGGMYPAITVVCLFGLVAFVSSLIIYRFAKRTPGDVAPDAAA